MKGGYVNRILRINLTDKKIEQTELSEEIAAGFISGRGLGDKILYDELVPGTDPLSPDNVIVLTAGVLTGTAAPFSARSWIVTKSPLSGTILMGNSGGYLGPELKFAGYDAVIIKGRAKTPTYLWIRDGKVEFRNASDLWGLGTKETQQKIIAQTDQRTKVACIGPAGEKLVKYACVISGDRAFGRGGSGAVFASKNLKALAISGNKPVDVAQPDDFKKVIKEILNAYQKNDFMQEWRKVGTVYNVGAMNELGIFPTKNFQTGFFEEYEKIDDQSHKKYVDKHITCFGCPVACTSWSAVKTGEYAGSECRGPEYETIWAFGSGCGNSNLESIIAANAICNEMGIDTESAGSTIGFAMELFERGIISIEDTEGIPLNFGNHESIVKMTRMICDRKGFGDILAEGTKRAAQKIGKGAEKYAINVKGLELDGYDPRGVKAQALSFATASRGGCHHSGYASQELYDAKCDRFTIKDKGKLTKGNEDLTALVDSTGICAFPFQLGVLSTSQLSELLYAATGIEEFRDEQYLLRTGERIFNLERLFNLREGFSNKDDVLPSRFLTEPMPTGNSKGQTVDFWPMRKEYYYVRGWTAKGVPKKNKLRELKLTK